MAYLGKNVVGKPSNNWPAGQPNGQPGSLNGTGLGAGIIRLFERKLFQGF